MASEGDKANDFYGVLGLNKECTESELRIAYKKLALKWHPDRCSASGNSKFVEEAKNKFQAIQQAYSVLSDANKRLMYDIGVYDTDDDENGMGNFLNEMVAIMSQTKSNENGGESFEELQQLFQDMFQGDIGSNGSTLHSATGCSASSSYMTFSETSNSNKRNCSEMNFGRVDDSFDLNSSYQNFCFGVKHLQDINKGKKGILGGGGNNKHRHVSKQKFSHDHDVSYNHYLGISAK
ncbi:putative DnaJ domain-containing protein [Lupinus albus]|uniref:Putative DnaJ domain-containing protein n=1 Tax=Lupinus albus TaxID=3870 RepID=A0A6A4QMZ3_LUPAL|nr:putative DnaJ domain-containing protein [Lupinus albus]